MQYMPYRNKFCVILVTSIQHEPDSYNQLSAHWPVTLNLPEVPKSKSNAEANREVIDVSKSNIQDPISELSAKETSV